MPTQLLNVDCMEYMKNCGDKFFDLAICDPPYGINIAKSGKVGGSVLAEVKDYGAKEWDAKPPEVEYFEELTRISKNQIIWGANHFISKIPIDSSCWIVWDKKNGDNNFADCELAFTSFNTAVRMFEFRWAGMLQENMKDKEQRIHPTQKPVALYKWLLKNYAEKGQKIIDTHLGSGSSAIAAHYFGCDFVGLEIDKDYFEAAQKRFAHETRQISMF